MTETELDILIDTALHPERNGLLIKEQVAEGASHEWLVKRELKAAIQRLLLQERIGELLNLKKELNNNSTAMAMGLLRFLEDRIVTLIAQLAKNEMGG